jgi:hypothetical protein
LGSVSAKKLIFFTYPHPTRWRIPARPAFHILAYSREREAAAARRQARPVILVGPPPPFTSRRASEELPSGEEHRSRGGGSRATAGEAGEPRLHAPSSLGRAPPLTILCRARSVHVGAEHILLAHGVCERLAQRRLCSLGQVGVYWISGVRGVDPNGGGCVIRRACGSRKRRARCSDCGAKAGRGSWAGNHKARLAQLSFTCRSVL